MNVKLLFSVLLAGLLLFGCTQQTTPTPTPGPLGNVVAPIDNGIGSLSPQEVSMTATSFEFQPSTITVKKGQRVKLTITAQDVPHGFSLPEFGIQRDLNPGTPETIEFTPDKAGSFTFACSVFCGAGHSGMRGTLVVEG